jgi:Rad3-related DNA helicase
MPYNYLLDAYLLTTYSELINDSIIIFDEAHNVAEAACEGRSLILETSNIEAALLELNGILSNYASKALMEVRLTYEK